MKCKAPLCGKWWFYPLTGRKVSRPCIVLSPVRRHARHDRDCHKFCRRSYSYFHLSPLLPHLSPPPNRFLLSYNSYPILPAPLQNLPLFHSSCISSLCTLHLVAPSNPDWSPLQPRWEGFPFLTSPSPPPCTFNNIGFLRLFYFMALHRQFA